MYLRENFICIEVPLYIEWKETLYLIYNLVLWYKSNEIYELFTIFYKKKIVYRNFEIGKSYTTKRLFIYLHFLLKIFRKNLIFEKYNLYFEILKSFGKSMLFTGYFTVIQQQRDYLRFFLFCLKSWKKKEWFL